MSDVKPAEHWQSNVNRSNLTLAAGSRRVTKEKRT